MINITERAKEELIKILSKKVDWPGARLRLMSRSQGKLGLGIDIEAPGDHIVEYKGVKVLLVEPELAKNLQGVTLDVDDTPEGVELVISEKSENHRS
jgi:Fe-S cluster assembly iron-binding protein IscA